MYPQDTQIIETNEVGGFLIELEWDEVLEEDASPSDPSANGIILCHATTPRPAAFLALFQGAAAGSTGDPVANPLDITASGRVAENTFTSGSEVYEDEPVLAYFTTRDPATKIMLAQELQSTGDDIFRCIQQTGVQPAPATAEHRLESVEPLVRRGVGVHPGAKIMRLNVTFSNILDDQEDTVGSMVDTTLTIPGLNSASPVKAVVGVDTRGRFFGFKLKGSVTDCVYRFLGAILRGRPVVP